MAKKSLILIVMQYKSIFKIIRNWLKKLTLKQRVNLISYFSWVIDGGREESSLLQNKKVTAKIEYILQTHKQFLSQMHWKFNTMVNYF